MTERHYTAHQKCPPDGSWEMTLSEGDHIVSATCEHAHKARGIEDLAAELEAKINPPSELPCSAN